MDSNRLTSCRARSSRGAEPGRRRSNNEVDTWHLLAALLGQEGGIVPAVVEKLGPDRERPANSRIEREPRTACPRFRRVDVSKIYVTQAVNEVFTSAEAGGGEAQGRVR